MFNNLKFQTILIEGLRKYSKNPALTFLRTNETVSYEELDKKSNNVASYFYKAGIKKGDTVVILIPNSIEYVIFSLGIIKCGATMIPLGEKIGNKELTFVLSDSRAKAVVVGTQIHGETVISYMKETQGENGIAIGIPGTDLHYPEGFHVYNWENDIEDVTSELIEASPDDLAGVFYSGGTTGFPKGIMHSQRSLGATLVANSIENAIDDRDRVFLGTPLPHAAGLFVWRSFITGAHVYISDKFDPEEFLNTVQANRITTTYMVPTVLYRVIDLGKEGTYDVTSLRTIHYGASPIDTERLKEAFDMFGPILKQHYGQTECPNMISRLTKSDHYWAYHNDPKALKSTGKACLFTQVRLLDDDGNEASRGEIVVKAPYLTIGYFNRPDLTEATFRDGWAYTGDIGEMDENGFLYIVDRKKDMIISGGMNVYSIEVENVINEHPAVAMSACVGVSDPEWGEIVTVFVVLKKEEFCSEKELIDFCKARTSKYMVPKKIYFRESFPFTAIGKIDKKELKGSLVEPIKSS